MDETSLPLADATTARRPGPRWKQGVATLVALYPLVLADQLLLAPRLQSLPLPLGTLLAITPVVAVMTYVLMPVTMRLLAPWMQGHRR